MKCAICEVEYNELRGEEYETLVKNLIKFVMEKAYKENGCDFPIDKIQDWINEFFVAKLQ